MLELGRAVVGVDGVDALALEDIAEGEVDGEAGAQGDADAGRGAEVGAVGIQLAAEAEGVAQTQAQGHGIAPLHGGVATGDIDGDGIDDPGRSDAVAYAGTGTGADEELAGELAAVGGGEGECGIGGGAEAVVALVLHGMSHVAPCGEADEVLVARPGREVAGGGGLRAQGHRQKEQEVEQ